MRLIATLTVLLCAAPALAYDPPVAAHVGDAGSHEGMRHDDQAAPKTPRILPGYGTGGFPITTKVPQAQAYFDNGMQLAHAFAHKAAIAAMAEAVRLDPACAMCLWGLAWASGPTINYGASAEEIRPLAAMADKAAGLAAKAGTDKEKALIRALQLRYKDGGGHKPGDLDFAKAMAALAARYPQDDEIAVMTADAWLMTQAKTDEQWRLNAALAMPLLEGVLKRSPADTGAIHFYIHASEIAGEAQLAEPYADRLAALAPRASHLVHMPSHTYYWVGRYQDAADTNMRAVQIGIENAKALGLPPPDGVWGLPYHVHNVTFGLGGAMEAGDAKTALALARPLVVRSQARDTGGPGAQLTAASGYIAMAEFADPAEVQRLPAPKLPILAAAWHYARGESFARRGDIAGVKRELAAIEAPIKDVNGDDGSREAQQLVFILRNVLAGRAAMLEHRPADAAIAFRQATEVQESPDFSSMADPPAWHYPIRRDLAAALLAAGDRAGARREAEAALVYRKRDPGTLALLAKLPASR